MKAPIITFTHIIESCPDTALCRNRVGSGREHLGDTGGAQTLCCHAQSCTQAGPASPDHNDIIMMVGYFISTHNLPFTWLTAGCQTKTGPLPYPHNIQAN